jgi:hypothetical protein
LGFGVASPLNFSKDTCILENVGFETIIFEKSTLNRTYVLKGDMREKYTMARRRILNFLLILRRSIMSLSADIIAIKDLIFFWMPFTSLIGKCYQKFNSIFLGWVRWKKI